MSVFNRMIGKSSFTCLYPHTRHILEPHDPLVCILYPCSFSVATFVLAEAKAFPVCLANGNWRFSVSGSWPDALGTSLWGDKSQAMKSLWKVSLQSGWARSLGFNKRYDKMHQIYSQIEWIIRFATCNLCNCVSRHHLIRFSVQFCVFVVSLT